MRAHTGSVGVRELRQNLSVYLALVKQGQVMTVTERGRAVAILQPLPKSDDAIARLHAEGRLIPGQGDLLALGPPLRIKLQKPLSRVLDELREDIV